MSRALLTLLFVLSMRATPHAGQATPAGMVVDPLERAQTVIEQTLQPLIERSRNGGLEGKILPDDLPVLPYHWSLQTDNTGPSATTFLHALRMLIKHAACYSQPEAIRFLFHIANTVDGFIFTESQSRYLERLAKSQNVEARFYERVRTLFRRRPNTSTEPQLVLRLNIAFDEGRAGDALSLVPAFARLCRASAAR